MRVASGRAQILQTSADVRPARSYESTVEWSRDASSRVRSACLPRACSQHELPEFAAVRRAASASRRCATLPRATRKGGVPRFVGCRIPRNIASCSGNSGGSAPLRGVEAIDGRRGDGLESQWASRVCVSSRGGGRALEKRPRDAVLPRCLRRAASTLCVELVARRRDSRPWSRVDSAGQANIFLQSGDAARMVRLSRVGDAVHADVASHASGFEFVCANWRRKRRKKKRE